MAPNMPPNSLAGRALHSDGRIPLLPVGSVRSIVTINSPTSNNEMQIPTASQLSLSKRCHRRRGLSIVLSAINAAPPSVSMTTSSYCDGSNGERDSRIVSMVATCSPSSTNDDDEGNTRAGRIALATIIESPNEKHGHRLLGVKHSSNKSKFATVCIASIQSILSHKLSLLLAIDTSGRIHTCPIWNGLRETEDNTSNHLLNMQECHFDATDAGAKRGKKAKSLPKQTKPDSALPPLSMMNTLTARLESHTFLTKEDQTYNLSGPEVNNPAMESPSVTSSTKKKGRKRKHSPDGKNGNYADRTTNTETIHLVASHINGSTLPSQSPPVVVVLSSADTPHTVKTNNEWRGRAWSFIPGLENVHVPMTSILYISRTKCGPIVWSGLLSAMRLHDDLKERENGHGEGVVLMGFQDGSLRASLIITKLDKLNDDEAIPNVTMDASKATRILQLSTNEPLHCLQLLSSQSGMNPSSDAPTILLCVGSLGSLVTLRGKNNQGGKARFQTEQSLKLCEGQWVSMACVGYHLTNKRGDDGGAGTLCITLVGINDSRRAYLHRVSFQTNVQSTSEDNSGPKYNVDCGQRIYRVPIPTRASSFMNCPPEALFVSDKQVSSNIIFSVSAQTGKTIVMKIPLTNMIPMNSLEPGHGRGKISSLLSATKKERSSSLRNHTTSKTCTNNTKGQSSKFQSLLQKLESAASNQNKKESKYLFDSVNKQFNNATKEIREATQIASFVNRPSAEDSMKLKKTNAQKPGKVECLVATEKLPLAAHSTTTWLPSVHVLQSCIHALSPALRPESIDDITTLCYRRNSRGNGRPTIVVYGGTASSYNSCGIDRLGGTTKIDISMNDLIPVCTYASWSMVYQNVNDTNWCKSVECQKKQSVHTTGQSKVFHLSASAKHASMNTRSCGSAASLGSTFPFKLTPHPNNTSQCIDILGVASNEDSNVSVGKSDNPRGAAESNVLQWYQKQSSQNNSQTGDIMPSYKEQQWILNHTRPSTTKDTRVYCCSSSLRFTNNGFDAQALCNLGFGPLAIVSQPDTDAYITGYAIGSTMITPGNTLSMLPLIRQALLRRSINNRSGASLKLHEMYRGLLSERQTAKIAKYIGRSSNDLLAKIETALNEKGHHSCPNDILATAISLYEIMRTINIAFHLQQC